MPIDPSIPLRGLSRQPVELLTPGDAQAQVQKEQLLGQEQQIRAAQLEKQRAEASQAQHEQGARALFQSAMQKGFKNGQLDIDLVSNELASGGMADQIPTVQKGFYESQRALENYRSAKLAADKAERDALASLADTAEASGDQAPGILLLGMAQHVHGKMATEDELMPTMIDLYQDPASASRIIAQMRAAARGPEKAQGERPVAQKTVDAEGNEVVRYIIPKEGDEYKQPTKPAAEAKAASVGSFEDYVGRRFGANPTDAQILQARKAYNQADDKAPRVTVNTTGPAPEALTPEAISLAAMNYRITGVMPPLGMGDKTTRQRILNRAATLTPDDMSAMQQQGTDIAANKRDYRADSGSLSALQKQRDAITSFEQTAQKNIDVFLKTAGKVVDIGSPLGNRIARHVTGNMLGSSDQAAYDAARQVAINEIAKITANPTLSGQLSDSARHEVEAFNPEGATLKQTVAVMRLLKQDMKNRTDALDATIGEIKGRQPGRGSSAPGGAKSDPLGIR